MSTSSDNGWIDRKDSLRTVIAGSTSKRHEEHIESQYLDILPVAKSDKGESDILANPTKVTHLHQSAVAK